MESSWIHRAVNNRKKNKTISQIFLNQLPFSQYKFSQNVTHTYLQFSTRWAAEFNADI